MLENRGDYFKNRIEKLEGELEKLQNEKKGLQKIISASFSAEWNTPLPGPHT